MREWKRRKPKETKKLIVKSLLEKPKSVLELANELCIKNGTVLSHLKRKTNSLMSLEIVKKVEERILRKGGYAKADIFGIANQEKARKYLENNI